MDTDVLTWATLQSTTQAGGTVRWMAPEIIDGAETGLMRPTCSSDVYSLASVMFEVGIPCMQHGKLELKKKIAQALSGQVPYYEFPLNITVIAKVIRGIKPNRPKSEMAPELSDHIWEIMQECWSDDPSDRPTTDQVLEQLRELAPLPPRPEGAETEPGSPVNARYSALLDSDITFLMKLVSEPQVVDDFYTAMKYSRSSRSLIFTDTSLSMRFLY